jgi:hypothetical protein
MLRLEVSVDFTPPLRGYTDNTFFEYFAQQGDLWDMGIGSPGTEVHPFWSIDMTDPDYTGQSPWSATFIITDVSGKGLTDEQVGILRAWIDQGMRWPKEITFFKHEPANLRARQLAELPASGKSVASAR